ncbi:SIS domain-containing protein [uncultured Marinococcus sp.]|uniref:SIS domain-containing protein n=1 Tax=uncultured Marinococcus sp. TaxID=487012 RepID=UPI0026069FCD|nr:SIS domain-containing protein [uncultured Marinococcus sp.]
MIENYFSQIREQLSTVEAQEYSQMEACAKAIANTLTQDGVIHLFGCGHSHLLSLEVYYRAGGLVPLRPILHEPVMLHEGALRSSKLERTNNYASTFLANENIQPEDTVIVISTSGRNPVPIDVALHAKTAGAAVAGLTSVAYSSAQPSRHKDGFRLMDVVDIVLDNHAPPGDALLTHPDLTTPFASSSTAVGTAMLQAAIARAIEITADRGETPPIFASGNADGGDAQNEQCLHKYRDRLGF